MNTVDQIESDIRPCAGCSDPFMLKDLDDDGICEFCNAAYEQEQARNAAYLDDKQNRHPSEAVTKPLTIEQFHKLHSDNGNCPCVQCVMKEERS